MNEKRLYKMVQLSQRTALLKPSPTLAISAKATALKKEGLDVIGLGVGEPDFNTPSFIIDAAKKAMDEGYTKYTPVGGIIELKEAIQEKMFRDNQLSYETNEIIVTPGAKYALYVLFQILLDEDDEVIIPAPYWVSYPEQVTLAGGKPVWIEGKEANDYKITAEQLKDKITNKTKALVLNSPSNPSGMMYDKAELEAIGQVCLENNVTIVSDEIYEKLIYVDTAHVSIASLSEKLKAQTIVINGVSKSHAMTGWRMGYACGPSHVIKAMSDYASQSTSNPTSISQYAMLEAYINKKSEQSVNEMHDLFAERLDRFYSLLIEIPGIVCKKPHGAFYVFPNVAEAAKLTGYDSVDAWCNALLEEELVAVVPGSGFGSPDNIRLSYATSLELLEEAAKRIKRFVENNMH